MTAMEKFKPLLAATVKSEQDLYELKFPMIASPKVDGIRTFVHPELGPVTRTLKPVPNKHIRESLNRSELHHLDGELVVGDITAPDVFNRSQSGAMTHDGSPQFTYYVFDTHHPTATFVMRQMFMKDQVAKAYHAGISHAVVLPYHYVKTVAEVLEYETACLMRGFEGIMLRSLEGRYKYNRSTLKEQILLKVKRFSDDEATIIGVHPRERNHNPPARDLLGYLKRTSHTSGLVTDAALGALHVTHPKWGDFSIGSGFDEEQRQEYWVNRDELIGRKISFKYQESGSKDKPRFPIFKGLRSD